jgi:mRNA interferase HigB
MRYCVTVHVISQKALQQFWERYPDSKSPLSRWYKIVQKTEFASFNELRPTFPSADKVGDLIVFNIGGNKYRLVTAIHFNRKKVFIRNVLTHAEYDGGAWKNE